MRNTWLGMLRANSTLSSLYKVFFIVGLQPDLKYSNTRAEMEMDEVDINLDLEAVTYGDILQTDIIENYKNISLKVMFLFEYMARYCSGSPSKLPGHEVYHLKGDDDILLVPENLHAFMERLRFERHRDLPLAMYGAKLFNVGPIRSPLWKWYLPSHIYPDDLWGFDYLAGKCFFNRNLVF